MRVLGQYPRVSERTLAWLREQSEATRIAVVDCFDALADLVRESGDDDLGLKAGAQFRFGEAGALDFAMHSASSLRAGVGVASRHARLWSDAFDPRLELVADRALVRLDGILPWPRAVAISS